MSNLLLTKIQLPPISSKHIHRARLIHQIEREPEKRLILVSAPAGFGKSSCLIEWAYHIQENGVAVAWYALDSQDNDPARFAAYLLHAVRQLDGSFAQLPGVEDGIGIYEATNLIGNLAQEVAQPLTIILDDYHLITTPDIHDALGLLSAHLPENLRLVIGTRSDPPLQLARLRAGGQVAEIRMADLRFTPDELLLWLGTALGWEPDTQTIQQLDSVTEGWAAALSLIIMTVERQQLTADEGFIMGQLARYSQTQRHIFDYFAQEVLDQQAAPVRDFLLDTCVLSRLRPELCEALTGNPAAPRLLSDLADKNLFLISLSQHEPIYRYHHLFEGFLRDYVRLKDAARYERQHRRAAEWHAAHDNIVMAIDHALAAQDFETAAHLIVERAWQRLMSRGEMMTLVGWSNAFPEKVLRQQIRLCLYFARALYLTGHVAQSEALVQFASDALDTHPDEPALFAMTYNAQATLAAYRGDMLVSLEILKQANEYRDAVDTFNRAQLNQREAFVYYYMGDVPASRTIYEETLNLAHDLGHHFLILDIEFYLAHLDLLQAELSRVKARCERIIAQYTTRMGAVSPLMLPLATVHYQRNELDNAEDLLREAITIAQMANLPDTVLFGHVALADILLVRGQTKAAENSLVQARHFARNYESPMLDSYINAAMARFWLRSGKLEQAHHWSEQYQQADEAHYNHDYEDLTLAQVWLAQGAYEHTREHLNTVISRAGAAGRVKTVLEAQVLNVLVHRAEGDTETALDVLEKVLALAQPHGFVRLFLDAGEPLLRLLRTISQRTSSEKIAAYARTLSTATVEPQADQHPADVLTERELEVLQCLAEGASNKAIAEMLVISLGTAKSHIHHIMSKLDVRNRTEAVSKARTMGLLD